MKETVERGETLSITRDGHRVAELRSLGRRSFTPSELIARARRLPPVDPDRLRTDSDEILDQTL